MDNRKFAGLLRRAARLAIEGQAVRAELTKAFTDRYGCTYSDVDCDSIIDVLDINGGKLSVAEADELMADRGAPLLRDSDHVA